MFGMMAQVPLEPFMILGYELRQIKHDSIWYDIYRDNQKVGHLQLDTQGELRLYRGTQHDCIHRLATGVNLADSEQCRRLTIEAVEILDQEIQRAKAPGEQAK